MMTLKELRKIIESIDKSYDIYNITTECECLGFSGNYYINEEEQIINFN